MTNKLVAVDAAGNLTQVEQQAIEAPMVVTDSISTSKAGVFSADASDDKSDVLAQILEDKKYVTIDTQIALNSEVYSRTAHQKIFGAATGSLLIGPDMMNKTALRIAGDHTIVQGIQMYNPLEVVDREVKTTRQAALGIEAHHVTVRDSLFDQMLHSVYVLSSGEWQGANILGNRALNCLGAGAGPSDVENGWGEDKGDAFTVWGGGARVIGNFAHARPDQDCRVAFHAEGLPGSHWAKNALTDESDLIYANNQAIGPFRRHFVFEDVKRGIMVGNVSSGGATWWPLALIQTFDCQVNGMIIRVTRTKDDLTGQKWAPSRAAICIMNYGARNKISNVQATWSEDAAMAAVHSFDNNNTENNGHHDTIIENSEFYMNANNRSRGIIVTGLTSPEIRNVTLHNCAEPVYGWRPKGRVKISGLRVKDFAKPLYIEGAYEGGLSLENSHFDNSTLVGGATTAVNTVQTAHVALKNNTVEGLTNLAVVGNVSGSTVKTAYLKHLTATGNESVDSEANIKVDGKTVCELPFKPNVVNNINIVGEFTLKQSE